MNLKPALPLAAFLLIAAPPAAADFITGQVVDSLGNPVSGVDIDAKDLINGGDATLFNDGTDINGFFTTTIPAGLFRLTFTPPPPPATTHLSLRMDDVVVVGTTNLGMVGLPQGVSVGGTLVDVNSLPVANGNIDVIDSMGNDVDLVGDNTGPTGAFLIAVPVGPIDFQIKTNNVLGVTLAPRAMQMNLSSNLTLGNVVLQPGFHVSGQVLNNLSAPVQGADTDMTDSVTGQEAFTPNDNTDAAGNFSVVVAAGTWDLEICPPAGSLLVADGVQDLAVAANTSLGAAMLQAGVLLSGTVTDAGMLPVQGVDVDVRSSTSGVAVALCNDNTNASGNYSVVVPNGMHDVTFEVGGGIAFHNGFTVSGNTVLDSTLTACPSATASFRSFGANPASLTCGTPALGKTLSVSVDLTTTGHSLCVIFGFASPLTFPLASGQVVLANVADPNGELLFQPFVAGPVAVFDLAIPPNVAFCAFPIAMQAMHFGAIAPFALSNAQDLVLGTSF